MRLVTIPGGWVPANEEGVRLVTVGYPTILETDRVESYTYWQGLWKRHHVGD